MNIRPATAADVPGVLPMVEKIISTLHETWDAAATRKLPNIAERIAGGWRPSATARRAFFLVAEREGKLSRFLSRRDRARDPDYLVEQYGFIHDLWVDEAYRHEGHRPADRDAGS